LNMIPLLTITIQTCIIYKSLSAEKEARILTPTKSATYRLFAQKTHSTHTDTLNPLADRATSGRCTKRNKGKPLHELIQKLSCFHPPCFFFCYFQATLTQILRVLIKVRTNHQDTSSCLSKALLGH
jgi:hypothetical protein